MSDKKEEEAPMPSTSKEDDQAIEYTKFRLNRSISLSKIESEPTRQDSNQKKRKDPPSPKGKVNVKETTSKF